jgi:hypothetical protein
MVAVREYCGELANFKEAKIIVARTLSELLRVQLILS